MHHFIEKRGYPPYLINNHNTACKSELSKYINSYNDELYINNLNGCYDYKILEEILRVLKKVNLYIFCNGEQIPFYIRFFVLERKCKMDIVPKSYEDAKTVFLYPINNKDKKKWKHPTIKTEALIRKLIRNSSRENVLLLVY